MQDQHSSTAISGTFLRTRDKILQEKHQKDLAALEYKVNKVKWANRDVLTQLFEANNRGHNLAVNIGFNDIYHALSIVSSHPGTSYLTNIERVKAFEEDVIKRTAENAGLKEELDKMREERDALKSQLDAEREHAKGNVTDHNVLPPVSPSKTNVHRLSLELATLRSRYDSLVDVRQRSVARYKLDYKKWSDFKAWLFGDDASDKKRKLEEGGKSAEEKRQQHIANVLRKRKMFLEMGPNLDSFCGDNLDDSSPKYVDSNKENKGCTTPLDKKQSVVAMAAASDATASAPLALHSLNKPNPSSSCMSTPAAGHPSSNTSQEKQNERACGSSSLSMLKRRHSGKILGHDNVPGSSDTEDESQVPDAAYLASVPAPVPILLHSPTKLAPQHASENHADIVPPSPHANPDAKRPRKIRRLSPHDDDALDSSSDRRDVGGWSAIPSEHQQKGKAREKQNAIVVTPAAADRSKVLSDYSAYKGRGRYAVDMSTADETINALYAIDPKRNGGLDFQFDEVVRSRADRKKMDAGDCECCRDYYEAVGPLPKRLQQPLWRSPPTTPVKPCQHQSGSTHTRVADSTVIDTEFDTNQQQAISDHRQAISRHRHRWARASTPPGYWNIGFPSTQEAADINKRAKAMHKAKRDSVEGEIKRGDGKYKKR